MRQLSSERPCATSRTAGSSGRAGGRDASSAAGGHAGTRAIPRRSRARPPPQPDDTAASPPVGPGPGAVTRPSPTREADPARAQLVQEAIQAAQGAWRQNQQLGYQKAEAYREASTTLSDNLLPYEQREMAAQLKVQTCHNWQAELMTSDLKHKFRRLPSERAIHPAGCDATPFRTC